MKLSIATLLAGIFLFGTAQAATQHDNYVFFDIQGLSDFNFTQTGYSITSGQPYGGTSSGVKQEDGHLQAYILVKAGRKGSKTPANWFKTQAGDGQSVVCDSAGTYPNELNFAVQGTMTVTLQDKRQLVCDAVISGQGHFTGANNWWLASPTMNGAHVSISGAAVQMCKITGSLVPVAVVFSPKTPCVNHFSMGFLNN